jgi:hypothetical protein
MSRWPNIIKEDMWPFAIRHMVAFHNASIRRGYSATPYKLFTGQDAPWSMSDFRVFGCPTYVLHKRLQDGDNYNKWRSRCWQGVYVSPSTCHASNIPLIFNPANSHISPQFHVTFDEGFTSVLNTDPTLSDKVLSKLYAKATWVHTSLDPETEYHFDTFWAALPAPLLGSRRSAAFVFQTVPPDQSHTTHLSTSAGPDSHPLLTYEGVSPPGTEQEGVSSPSNEPEGVSPPSIAPEGVSPPIIEHEGVSSSDVGVSPDSALHTSVSLQRPQYQIYSLESAFTSMKRRKVTIIIYTSGRRTHRL